MEEKTKRKFQDKITIGTIKKMGWKIGDIKRFQDIESIDEMEIEEIIKLLNAMIIEGEPFSDDEGFEALGEATSFLMKSRRLKAAKDKLKEKRSPNS